MDFVLFVPPFVLTGGLGKEDIRRMERTLSVNYPVLRQTKCVLLNTFVKNYCLKSHQCTYERQEGIDRWIVHKEILETLVFYERIQSYTLILP